MPGALAARPGFLYRTPMTTLIRILCLALCLGLAGNAAVAMAETAPGQDTQPKAKSSKSKKDSSKKDAPSKKSKGKDKAAGQEKKSSGKKSSRKAALPSGPGFRSLAWGAPLSALQDPDLREESGGLKYYTVPGDDMMVDGVHMREIAYVFCRDKLAGVLTRYDGAINHLTLLAKLREEHGTPLESPPNVQGDRSWRFDAGDSTIMMEYSEKASTGAMAWMARERVAICQPAE